MSSPGLLCVLDQLVRQGAPWHVAHNAHSCQDSHSGHGGEHPTQLHGSLLVAALLLHGGGRLPWGMGKTQMERKYPFSFPKSPEFTPSPGLCLPCWVQRHMNVLGCLQLVLGSVTALETEGQRAPACWKVCSLGTENFPAPLAWLKVQRAQQAPLCLGCCQEPTQPLPY